MVEKIKDPAKAEAWIRKALADKARIMGFGHRVYRVEDPRAKHLRRLALELGEQIGDTAYVRDPQHHGAGRHRREAHLPNVDLFSGAAYEAMGIATDQFTPIFAMSRVAGWAAHVLEQHGNNRLIRPRAEYTGPDARELRPDLPALSGECRCRRSHSPRATASATTTSCMSRRDLPFDLSEASIVRICDRNWGIGSDGILMLVPSGRADFGLRIFNPDGSEAEKSGNGLRIFSKWLRDHGLAKRDAFTIETPGGVVECLCHVRDGRVRFVTVEMGRATFRAPEIPMNGPDRDVVAVPLQLSDGTALAVTAVSVGNPHCITFVDRLDTEACKRAGPADRAAPGVSRSAPTCSSRAWPIATRSTS